MTLFLWILAFIINLSNAQTTCNTSECTIDNPTSDYYCPSTTQTCNINCDANRCSNITIYSHANQTYLDCPDIDSCNSVTFICGYESPSSSNTIRSCELLCSNENSCNNITMECNNNFNQCGMMTDNSTAAFDGTLKCDQNEYDGSCYLDCSGSLCGISSIDCESYNGFCYCIDDGSGCPGLIINELPPTSSPLDDIVSTMDDDTDNNEDGTLHNIITFLIDDNLLYTIIGGGVLVLCCCLCMIYLIIRKKRNNETDTGKTSDIPMDLLHAQSVTVDEPTTQNNINTSFLAVDNIDTKPRSTSTMIREYVGNELGDEVAAIQNNINGGKPRAKSGENDDLEANIEKLAEATGNNLESVQKNAEFGGGLSHLTAQNNAALDDVVNSVDMSVRAGGNDYLRGSLDFHSNMLRVGNTNAATMDNIVYEMAEEY